DHRHVQDLAAEAKWNALVFLGNLGRDRADRSLRDVLKDGARSVGNTRDLRERLAQGLLVDKAELDEAGPQMAAIDELRLERHLQLGFGDQTFSDEDLTDFAMHDAT